MCLVKIEKMPKLQTACTTVVTEGMIVTSDNEEVRQARKSMVELLLGNHPLDCPVCDAGGECELQDMTFSYGAAESKYMEAKNHKDEQQWSPVVFFDRPRCILCYRCVRVCGEGMDVWALGVQNRGVSGIIAPNREDHLECEECGMCIDICPVGALTSGAYRYKTRPWEMKHVGTTCTHCADGCKTTLGVRRADTGMEIVRGDNRDKSGINGDFLCIKGRYAFDFANHEDRLTQPLIRKNGRLTSSTWEEAFELIGTRFKEICDREGGRSIGIVGSTRTTNEENYLLQKFARMVLGTNNIDHHRTADFLAGEDSAANRMGTEEQWLPLRENDRGERNLVIIFGSELRGDAIAELVKVASSIPGAKLVCLGDYANSRGAADMGLYPDLLPGYHRVAEKGKFHNEWGGIPEAPGLSLPEMVASGKTGNLKALYVVGANPIGRLGIDPFAFAQAFVVVQDMFLTETAIMADVVLPTANAYEKSGTFTNTCGDLQIVKKAGEVTATKSDFEMIVRIADAMGFDVRKLVPFGRGTPADMGQSRGAQSGEADRHAVWLEAHGLEPKMSPFDPMAILDEIQRLVPGYDVSRMNLLAGNDEHTTLSKSGPGSVQNPELIQPANNNLFSSGTLGRYSRTLNSVIENRNQQPAEVAAD